MKKLILIMTISGVLFFQNNFDPEILQAQTANKSSAIANLHSVGNYPNMVAKLTAAQAQSSVASNPQAQSLPIIAPPADIASLTAKEILAANNQVVNHLASMYQNFGLFLTIIVTLVGIIATGLSFMANKSVKDFIKEWNKKIESIESEMKASLNRLNNAVSEAESSARKAAASALSVDDSKIVLNKSLEDVARMQASIALLHPQDVGEQHDVPPSSKEAVVIPPPSQFPDTDEDAEVSARLKGKINSTEGEG
jgi:hypothetical protein